MYRKISANYIFPLSGKPVKNGILTVDAGGTILDISSFDDKEPSGVEFYSGVLVPGFVNAHCHSELPHIKGLLDCRRKGLPEFISQIIAKRFTPDNLQELIKQSDFEMFENGIAAVGDISNTDDTFTVKSKSKIDYFTFVEAFGVSNEASAGIFEQAKKVEKKLIDFNLPGNIVPHAPYSVPEKLFEFIEKEYSDSTKIVSVHNQETQSENELFTNRSGALHDTLSKIGFCYNDFVFSGKNGLQTTLSHYRKDQNILLVHNVFTSENDINFAEQYSDQIFWVLCPNSNLFIENRLPDIEMFVRKNVKICLGTDSYASNDALDILSEMKTVLTRFPAIAFETILRAACLTGAQALKKDKVLGSFEIGKKPGINLIDVFDFSVMKPSDKSRVKRMI